MSREMPALLNTKSIPSGRSLFNGDARQKKLPLLRNKNIILLAGYDYPILPDHQPSAITPTAYPLSPLSLELIFLPSLFAYQLNSLIAYQPICLSANLL
ncbi:hypothetical protein ACFL9U_15480 [Thermodesulfobacteriota bacterium]